MACYLENIKKQTKKFCLPFGAVMNRSAALHYLTHFDKLSAAHFDRLISASSFRQAQCIAMHRNAAQCDAGRRWLLPTALLPTANCSTANCLLPTALLPTAYCLLLYCLLQDKRCGSNHTPIHINLNSILPLNVRRPFGVVKANVGVFVVVLKSFAGSI